MKIGFVLDDGLEKPDGVQQYILTLGTHYRSLGHEVRYLVGETKRTDIEGAYSMSKNIKVRFNGNVMSIPLPASTRKIKRVLNAEKFDVLHIQVPYSPFMGAKVVRYAPASAAVVGTFHILPFGWISWVGTRLLGLWLHHNLKRFDAMLSVSAPAAKFAKQTFKVDSKVVPNLVDTAIFRPPKDFSRPQDGLRLMFLGRLVERKGCRQLVEALAELRRSDKLPKDMQIDICGDGSSRPQLERLVKKYQLDKQVIFHGFVTHDQKVSLMRNADIAAFPSLSGESFGIVLIEAIAAGAGVVLAGNNPGYSSVLGTLPDSMVSPRDVPSFAAHLHELIIDPARRARLHKQQQEHVLKFDVAVVADQLLSVYGSCKDTRNR